MFLTVALNLEVVINPLFADPFAPNRLVATRCGNCVSCHSENARGFRRWIVFLDSHWWFIRCCVLNCTPVSVSVLVSRKLTQVQIGLKSGVFQASLSRRSRHKFARELHWKILQKYPTPVGYPEIGETGENRSNFSRHYSTNNFRALEIGNLNLNQQS